MNGPAPGTEGTHTDLLVVTALMVICCALFLYDLAEILTALQR